MQPSHEEIVEVNFRRRETEGGWFRTLDRFGLAAAPVWFDWLEWVLVLGAFEYFAGKNGAWLARLISAISIPILWFYFNGFFFRIYFRGWFRIRSANTERIVSIFVSGILASGCWYAAQAIAKTIAANTK